MIVKNGKEVRELRCRSCRSFITYERIYAGIVIHTCSKCGFLNEFEFRFLDVPSNHARIKKEFTITKGGE